MSDFVVIKLSGSVLEHSADLALLPDFIRTLQQSGQQCVLVHGAGKQLDSACIERQIPIEKINGRRITTDAIRDVMLEIIHGNLNRKWVGILLSAGIPAIGITSGDAGIFEFEKRPLKNIDGNWIDFGWVGDLKKVNSEKLLQLTTMGVPVISCLGFSPKDGWLNVNADTITKETAFALQAKKVFMISELSGVFDANKQHVRTLKVEQIRDGIKQKWITDGMVVKLEQATDLAKTGIQVEIGSLQSFFKQQTTVISK